MLSWSTPGNSHKPKCQPCSRTPSVDTWDQHSQEVWELRLPCRVSLAHEATEGSHVVLAQWGPAAHTGGVHASFLPLLMPKNPLESLQSPCARPWTPVHTHTHCHSSGPRAKPTLDPLRARLLSPSAAGEIEERQTGSSTGQSGQHTQAIQQLRPVIPSQQDCVQPQHPMISQHWYQFPQAAGLAPQVDCCGLNPTSL